MNRIRRISQVFGTLLSHGYLSVLMTGRIYSGPLKGVCIPFLGCYACPVAIFSCPIGSLQHFAAIRVVPFLLLGVLGLIGVLIGRMTCGWLCPFGLLQDLMYRIPTRKIEIPRSLSLIKYAVLVVLVLIIPFATGMPWFSRLCPAGTLTAGLPWVLLGPNNTLSGVRVVPLDELGGLFALKLFILVGFLTLFVLSKRPFCRTTCPLGAILSLMNRYSLVKIEVSRHCRRCGRCREVCPVDLQVCLEPNSTECIRCLNCTSCKHVSVSLRGASLPDATRGREGAGHGA